MSSVTNVLAGGVFAPTVVHDEYAELRVLVDEIGRRSFAARLGRRGRPEQFDEGLWSTLEESGLTRLTSTDDGGGGPAELAVVLRTLARHSCAVPVAETDLLAAFLGREAALSLPVRGPLTVALAVGGTDGRRITGTASDVPWPKTARALALAVQTSSGSYAGVVDTAECDVIDGENLAAEPYGRVTFDLPLERLRPLGAMVFDELVRRGAWARCVQVMGALDAAAESTVAFCRERVQFGRSLSNFQSVQHSLATMAGEIERGRAATTLAVTAAAADGFSASRTDYAVTVAKVTLGRVVPTVVTTAHQLHGAIGVTVEHSLWLSTMRARSWICEFGSTGHYARRLGRLALSAEDPWDCVIGAHVDG